MKYYVVFEYDGKSYLRAKSCDYINGILNCACNKDGTKFNGFSRLDTNNDGLVLEVSALEMHNSKNYKIPEYASRSAKPVASIGYAAQNKYPNLPIIQRSDLLHIWDTGNDSIITGLTVNAQATDKDVKSDTKEQTVSALDSVEKQQAFKNRFKVKHRTKTENFNLNESIFHANIEEKFDWKKVPNWLEMEQKIIDKVKDLDESIVLDEGMYDDFVKNTCFRLNHTDTVYKVVNVWNDGHIFFQSYRHLYGNVNVTTHNYLHTLLQRGDLVILNQQEIDKLADHVNSIQGGNS